MQKCTLQCIQQLVHKLQYLLNRKKKVDLPSGSVADRFRILLFTLMRIRILPFTVMRIRVLPFNADPDPTTHFFPYMDPPRLQNDPLLLPPFQLHADPDPDSTFHFDGDPDPASQMMRIHAYLYFSGRRSRVKFMTITPRNYLPAHKPKGWVLGC